MFLEKVTGLRNLINLSRRPAPICLQPYSAYVFELAEADQWCFIKVHQLLIFLLKTLRCDDPLFVLFGYSWLVR
jgi:hypothetical protein